MSYTPYLNVGILPLQMPISFQFPLQAYMAVGNWTWLHIHLGIYASLICMNTKRENHLYRPPFIRNYSCIIIHLDVNGVNLVISLLAFLGISIELSPYSNHSFAVLYLVSQCKPA